MRDGMILALDFGGPNSRALARKVRNEHVYCEILPWNASAEDVRARAPLGVILTGVPECEDRTPALSTDIYALGVPMLGIGYGARVLMADAGGTLVDSVADRQTAKVRFGDSPLFRGLTECERLFESMDTFDMPDGFRGIAEASGTTVAFACEERGIFGMQFGAEQNDPDGLRILHNFCVGICHCREEWSMPRYMDWAVRQIRERVGQGSVLTTISGGVDSAVCAALMHRAIGGQLHCLHVDTGLMRKGEGEFVSHVFREQLGMDLRCVEASERFLSALSGVTEADEKRRVVDEVFARVFADEARRMDRVDCVALGTIYTDVLDTGDNPSLPDSIECRTLLEPVRCLFKEEVRELGELLGLPPEMVRRQAFPGPGFAVRCAGEVTRKKVAMLREADAIFRDEIGAAGLEKRIRQYFAVLLAERTQADGQGVGYTVALRAVNLVGASEWMAYRLPYDLLERVVARIVAEVDGVNRVVYDVTPRPPAAIEWI